MLGTKKKSNRKWEKRPQLYRGRFFYVRQLAQIVLGLCAVVAVAALWLYFQNSEALRIRTVTVLNEPKHISKDGVIALSGIHPGDRLFGISLADVEINILRHPWVDRAMIRREFPDTIQIHVVERESVALMLIDKLYLVDENAVPFKAVEKNDPVDLPIISGLSSEEAKNSPTLARRDLKNALSFLKLVQASPVFAQNAISELNINSALGYSVLLKDYPLEIFYGYDNLDSKLHKLEKFSQSQPDFITRYVRLDLASPGRVIARAANPLVAKTP